jgi:hypothetical protein
MSFISKVAQMTIDIAVTPIEIVKDVATLGGAVVGEDEPYTVQRLKQAAKRASEAYDELDK